MSNSLKIVIAILMLCGTSFSQTITGYIYDENQQPLAWANIIVQNSNLGTASNSNGAYLLKLKEGNYKLIFQYLGYKPDTVSITLEKGKTINRNVELVEEEILQKTIVVQANRVNVAEQIILNVIENKDEYLSALKNYEYDAYTKTLLEVQSKDSVIIGGILETISKAYYESPDKFQEIILSKKQTENFTEANNIFTIGKIPNVLEEYILFDELAVISPLNESALDFYSFNMIDTLVWADKTIFEIGITPKKENIPLFKGRIKVTNNEFTIVGLHLEGDEIIKTAVKKDFVLSEEFREYNKYFWLPVNVNIHFKMDLGIPGFPDILFNQQSVILNYRINSDDFKYKFDNNLVTVATVKEEKAKKLWDEFQAIPLTVREVKAVNRIDSIITNGSWLQKGMIGLSKLMSATDSTMLTNFSDYYHFNKVEGNYIGAGFNSKSYLQPFYLKINGGYGFADEKIKADIELDYNFYKHKLYFKYDDQLCSVDRFTGLNQFDVTLQSIFSKNDYNDYYYKKNWEAGIELRLSTLLKSKIFFATNKSSSVKVNSDWSLFARDKKYRKAINISEGRRSELGFSLSIDSRKFYNFGWVKVPVGSQYYTFIEFDYIHSTRNLLESDYSYNIYHLFSNCFFPINNYLNINLGFSGGVSAGDQVVQNSFYLPGFYYLVNEPLALRTITSKNFIGNKCAAVFWENNFGNYLFNLLNIPYLENSKYDFYVFVNGAFIINENVALKDNNFITYGESNLWEVGWGISNILGFMKLDFAWAINKIDNQHSFTFELITNLQL